MVLGTIIDNIKSFFQKEERLLQEPQKVPDAASEVLGEPQPVVERPLPKETAPRMETKPELPFSAKELQAALKKQETPAPAPREQSQKAPYEVHELESEYVSDDELLALEETMDQLHAPKQRAASTASLKDGFFSSFEDFLSQGSLDRTHLDGDLLQKMRSFHQRRLEGKEPLVSKQSAAEAVRRRLRDLQSLEHEWERLYAESRDVERNMIHVEEEIEEKTRALRSLLVESEHVNALAHEVSDENVFVLANGVRVRSVGALLRAVRNDPGVFNQHVSTQRNDFALWIRHSIENPDLAQRVQDARSVDAFLLALRSN